MPAPTLDQQFVMVVLCQGQLADGNAYWAYLQIKPSKAKAFKQAQASGAFDLEEYGEVIEWGTGEVVPDDVRQRMEKEHGVNHDFEKDALELLKKKG